MKGLGPLRRAVEQYKERVLELERERFKAAEGLQVGSDCWIGCMRMGGWMLQAGSDCWIVCMRMGGWVIGGVRLYICVCVCVCVSASCLPAGLPACLG